LRKSDLLSSICFAGILILLIFPYGLLSVSFLLSFGSLLGIALFYQPLDRWLKQKFVKLPYKVSRSLSGAIAMYLSTTVMTVPLLINYFGLIGIFGMFTNLLLMPVLMLGFQMSVVALITVIGFPLLWIADLLVRFVIAGSEFLTGVVRIQGSGYFYVLFLAALVLGSRFIFVSKRTKFIAFATLMVGYLVTLAIFNL